MWSIARDQAAARVGERRGDDRRDRVERVEVGAPPCVHVTTASLPISQPRPRLTACSSPRAIAARIERSLRPSSTASVFGVYAAAVVAPALSRAATRSASTSAKRSSSASVSWRSATSPLAFALAMGGNAMCGRAVPGIRAGRDERPTAVVARARVMLDSTHLVAAVPQEVGDHRLAGVRAVVQVERPAGGEPAVGARPVTLAPQMKLTTAAIAQHDLGWSRSRVVNPEPRVRLARPGVTLGKLTLKTFDAARLGPPVTIEVADCPCHLAVTTGAQELGRARRVTAICHSVVNQSASCRHP